MVFAIKKQLQDYQSLLSIAQERELDTLTALSRYDFVTFIFVFCTFLYLSFILSLHHINLSLVALILHLFVGINLLKARKLIADALDALNRHEEISTEIARFLNRQYSLFLVSQGKRPLTDDQIETLEVHKARFVKNAITRGGRGDSIRRFRLHYLKREKLLYDVLFAMMIILELFLAL
ncbi:MAG: hypothetical protein B6D59_01380 [Campylobacteraceae bacterium 4484_4]|nr:MAG: hypothetical protein B6D59_01380 [Campylobacteraceae bacterium 4484_4]